MAGTVRAVFDCPIFVQTFLGAGPSATCFALAEQGFLEFYLSAQTLAEAEEVLERPALYKNRPDITTAHIEVFLTKIKAIAQHVADVPIVFSYPRDPKDEPYINLAVAAQAHFVVSRDKDLLDLMDATVPEAKAFQQQFPNLTILSPVQLLQALVPAD